MKLPLVPFALAILVLPSCFMSRMKTNVPLAPELAAQLAPGESTADDVVALLGAPNDVVQLGRRSAWRYDYTHTKRAALFLLVVSFMNEDTKQDRIWAFFDEKDVLTHFGTTYEADLAKFSMPWQDDEELEVDENEDGSSESEEEPMEGEASAEAEEAEGGK